MILRHTLFVTSLLVCLVASAAKAQPIALSVDLADAPRNIYHVRLIVPVKPGPVTLVYPKWIPGNHRPSGPIANLTGLWMEAAGKTLEWERDPVDMYAFHVNVPAGVKELTVYFDALTDSDSAGASGAAASSNLLDLNWNQVVLYPKAMSSDDVEVTAAVHLPQGWNFGTALPRTGVMGSGIASFQMFQTVSLTRLIDSPLIAGDHYRQVDLTRDSPTHEIDMVSESDTALQMTPKDVEAYKKLVAETGALFGARHYRDYHFLLTLSDQVGHHGLEHHESSDNSTAERTLIDPDLHTLEAGLLPHEFVHSWNGKYRRPAGLATPNYQEPMIGNLLWVYEGLTEYLGDVLTARSGLWTDQQYRDALAESAAMLDHRAGRTWRPLEDTARSVQILRLLGPEWESWRRSLDYYPEGELIWFEVDTTIRQQSHGQKSLNDFCKIFYGGEGGEPKVVPYTFDDVAKALNQVVPYDWAALLKTRVNATGAHAPLGGIERGGWRLEYNDQPNAFGHLSEKRGKYVNAYYSLGFIVAEDGELEDVIPGSPAYKAGIGPGMKLIAINGRRWSKDMLRDALRESVQSSGPMQLLVENAQFYKTYPVDYHGGEKNPHLVRSDSPDLLDTILQPMTK
jgi:predicted metalloprotease with PDZ domain